MKAFIVSLLLFLSVLSYSQDGTLDPSFGNNGVVQTDFYGENDTLYDIDIFSDGKILAGGIVEDSGSSELTIVKYNNNGTLDNTFGSNGSLVAGGALNWVVLKVLPDDTFLVVVSEISGNGDVFISKYSEDGIIDTQFGNNGTAQISYYENDFATDLELLSDNSVIVSARSDGQGLYYLTLFKILADGSLDTSFGNSGFTAIDTGDYFDEVTLEIQNGNALIASFDHSLSPTESEIVVYKFNLDGELDSSFGDNGIVTKTYQATFLSSKMSVDNNGKIVLTTAEWDDAPEPVITTTLFRYNTNGTYDNSFAQGGSHIFNIGFIPYSMNIQPNNRILVSGGIPGFESSFFVMRRFYNNGNPDPSFSFNGHSEFEGMDVELTPDERIITAGFSYWYDGDVDYVLAALNNSPLGLNEFSSNSISVYPNPTSGVINKTKILKTEITSLN